MQTFRQLEIDTSSEILHNLIRTFITETADRLRRMSEAAVAPDIRVLEAEAHALRSSSGAFGAHRLQEQATALELACRTGRVDDALSILRPIHGMALEASRALISRGNPTQTAAE
jgi:HPt (histidine-containing phosphotransfer) domain-containing protein